MMTTVLITLIAATAPAGQWTSPDGFVSVRTPDLERFSQRDSAPDFVKHWQSRDDYVQLCIVEDDWKSRSPIRRRHLEQGFLKDFDAQLTSSSVERIKGSLVFVMTCRTEQASQQLTAKQMVIPAGGKVYKFMAMSLGRDIAQVPEVAEFFDSVEILKSPPQVNQVRFRGHDLASGAPERIAGRIGEIVGFLLPFVIVAWLIKRSRQRVT